MSTLGQIALLIVLPLAWGLAAEWVFEWVRRRRASGREGPSGPHDWVI